MGIDLKEAPPSTRASMDGQVPDTWTYGDWLKRQPAAIQDEALGPTLGALYRKGGLDVDDFVSPNGRPLTLAQLTAKAGIN
jgi:hypothetical protein